MSTPSVPRPSWRLSSSMRRAVLTLHIVVSVGLLGDSAGFLAVAIQGASTDAPELARASYQTLNMFAFVFGIPLSFAALLTGLTLGIGSKWGVFRYPWVTAKLLLIISVILVGSLIISGGLDDMLSGAGGAEARLVAAAAYDVLALAVAASLGVYKPGRRWASRREDLLARRGRRERVVSRSQRGE
jgi:hypothetical protein